MSVSLRQTKQVTGLRVMGNNPEKSSTLPNKMNGWVRIGIAISALWFIGILICGWEGIINSASNSASVEYNICNDNNTRNRTNLNCYELQKNDFEAEKKNQLNDLMKNWYWSPIVLFFPAILFFIFWILSYGLLKIFYWVVGGFIKLERDIRIMPKSLIMAGIVAPVTILYFIAPPLPKILRVGLSALGCVAALIGAYYCLRAGNVSAEQPAASISDSPEDYILSNGVAFNESSRINSIAARWTGVAALFGAAASLAGIF